MNAKSTVGLFDVFLMQIQHGQKPWLFAAKKAFTP
jgi:hypothetical protein